MYLRDVPIAVFVPVLPGMEVAAALTDKAHSVSIIGIESVPFKKALGEKVGKAIMKVGSHPWEIFNTVIRTFYWQEKIAY